MGSISYNKIIKGLAILAVIVVIAMPDMVLEWLTEFVHLIFELLAEFSHLLFEGLETALDTLIEHVLETDRYSTQIVVFYIIAAILLTSVYGLYRWALKSYRYVTDGILVFWEVNKARAYLFWYSLTLMDKIKLAAASIAAISVYVFFLM